MNTEGKSKLLLVGVKMDSGEVKHVKAFTNKTWADKYKATAGVAAVVAEVEVEFK